MQTITLTYGQIKNPAFNQMYQRFLNTKLPFPVAQKFHMLGTLIQEHQKIADAEIKKVFEAHGDLIPAKDNQPEHRAIPKEKEAAADEDIKKIMDLSIETPIEKFDKILLSRFDIDVNELIALDPLIQGGTITAPPTQDQAPTASASPQLSAVKE